MTSWTRRRPSSNSWRPRLPRSKRSSKIPRSPAVGILMLRLQLREIPPRAGGIPVAAIPAGMSVVPVVSATDLLAVASPTVPLAVVTVASVPAGVLAGPKDSARVLTPAPPAGTTIPAVGPNQVPAATRADGGPRRVKHHR